MAVVEQRLPRSERGLRNGGRFDEIDGGRLRCQAANLDGDVVGGPAVAVPVDESVHLVTHRHAGGAVAEGDHDARPLVGRDPPPPVMPGAIGRERPQQLGRGEAGGAHLHECVADRRLGIGGVLEDEAIDALEALRFLVANSLHGSLLHIRECRDPGSVADLTDGNRCRSSPSDGRHIAKSTALCENVEYAPSLDSSSGSRGARDASPGRTATRDVPVVGHRHARCSSRSPGLAASRALCAKGAEKFRMRGCHIARSSFVYLSDTST